MTFAWPRFCQITLLASSLLVLSACGGGGGDGPSGSASVTVSDGSFYVPEGKFDSRGVEQQTDTYPVLGPVQIIAYDMGGFGVGIGYIQNFPQAYYFAVITTNSLEYSCVSQAWVDEFGQTAPTCPNSVVLNATTKQAQVTNTLLTRKDLSSDTVTVSGNFDW